MIKKFVILILYFSLFSCVSNKSIKLKKQLEQYNTISIYLLENQKEELLNQSKLTYEREYYLEKLAKEKNLTKIQLLINLKKEVNNTSIKEAYAYFVNKMAREGDFNKQCRDIIRELNKRKFNKKLDEIIKKSKETYKRPKLGYKKTEKLTIIVPNKYLKLCPTFVNGKEENKIVFFINMNKCFCTIRKMWNEIKEIKNARIYLFPIITSLYDRYIPIYSYFYKSQLSNNLKKFFMYLLATYDKDNHNNFLDKLGKIPLYDKKLLELSYGAYKLGINYKMLYIKNNKCFL